MIRNQHECEGGIENYGKQITYWHHKACRVMTNCHHKGQISPSYHHTNYRIFFLRSLKGKREGKDQESIQSSTIPTQDTIWESNKSTRKHHIQESKEVSPLLSGSHKLQEAGITECKDIPTKNTQKKTRLGRVSNKLTGGLKLVSRYQHPKFYCE